MQQHEISACYKIITGRRIPSSFLIHCSAQENYLETFKMDNTLFETVRQRILAALPSSSKEPDRNILQRIVDDVVERVSHHKNMPFVVQHHLLRHDFTHHVTSKKDWNNWGDWDVTILVQQQQEEEEEEEEKDSVERLCCELYTENPCSIQFSKDAAWIVPRCCAHLVRTYGLTEDMETFGLLRHVFVINLRRRQDRRERIGAVLKDLGMPFTLFPACDPIEDPYWRDAYSHYSSRRINHGEFGLVQTTLLVLREAIERNLKYVLLLEDDVVFCKDFRRRFGEAIQKVPPDWNIIYLGAKQYGRTRAETRAEYFYPHNVNTTGSHAMLLRRSCLPVLLEHFSLNQDRPVDESIKVLFHQKGTIPASTVYVLHPNLVITLCGGKDTISDIQSLEKNEEETYSFWGWDVGNFAL